MRKVLAAGLILAFVVAFTACGIDADEWRDEIEPLLPEGVTIVSAESQPCGGIGDCLVDMRLSDDVDSHAETARTFATALAKDGWRQRTYHENERSAGGNFRKNDASLSFQLNEVNWTAECRQKRGSDYRGCQNSITVKPDAQ